MSASATATPAEAPPTEAVRAALSTCASPECEYPHATSGGRRLAPDSSTGGVRWCIQVLATIEGQERTVAVIVAEDSTDPAVPWRPGDPQTDVSCATVE